MLDRHHSAEPGTAVVEHESGGVSSEIRIWWHGPAVWRVEDERGVLVTDGVRVQEWQGSRRSAPRAVRPGHHGPAYFLQSVFPLRAAVLGRSGDDYFPARARRHEQGVLVELEGTEDDRRGHLVVDADGFLREVSLLAGETVLRLKDLVRGPLDDPARLFAVQDA